MSAEAFAAHLQLAVGAGEPLALVVLRCSDERRACARLEEALCAAEGFAYELQPGGYALLMPGASAAEALQEASTLRCGVRGALLRAGTLVDAGVATLEPGMDERALFATAAGALSDAALTGAGVMLARPAAHA